MVEQVSSVKCGSPLIIRVCGAQLSGQLFQIHVGRARFEIGTSLFWARLGRRTAGKTEPKAVNSHRAPIACFSACFYRLKPPANCMYTG